MNPEQIEAMALPTRPTKRSDSRSKNFEGGALSRWTPASQPPCMMAMKCIVQHIDSDVHSRMIDVETAESRRLPRSHSEDFGATLIGPRMTGTTDLGGNLDLPEN